MPNVVRKQLAFARGQAAVEYLLIVAGLSATLIFWRLLAKPFENYLAVLKLVLELGFFQ